MKKIISGVIFSIIGISVFSGCGSSIKLSDYKSVSIQKSKYAPSKEIMMKNSVPKVIIMDLDNNRIKRAKDSKLGRAFATKISSQLSDGKGVQIAKRINKENSNNLLSKEIKAKELSLEMGIDVGQVDYLITGTFSNSTFNHSFEEASKFVISGKTINVPPKMTHTACVSGNVKIFSLPNLKEEKNIGFENCAVSSTEVKSARNYVLRDDGLVRSAGEESADSVTYELKNFFAKKGYIYEMRKDDSEVILKTSLGSKDGAKIGEDVEIYTIKRNINPLTDVVTEEETLIGVGIISDKITLNSSWIKVSNFEDSSKVLIGDFIKIRYEESILNKALKQLK